MILLDQWRRWYLFAVRGPRFVAQIFNLPYRRLAVGRAWDSSHASAFPNVWQSATLRYSAARQRRNQTPSPPLDGGEEEPLSSVLSPRRRSGERKKESARQESSRLATI